MSSTQPPIITAVETVNAAYRVARERAAERPTHPALMIAAHTAIADALDARIALIEAEMHRDVDLGMPRPDLGGWAADGRMPLVLADPVKFWALQRAVAADRRDAKSARELADWWGNRPDPSRRRSTGRARARRG